jgi:hypothetical protein
MVDDDEMRIDFLLPVFIIAVSPECSMLGDAKRAVNVRLT